MTTLYANDFDTTPAADETSATTAAHTSGGAGIGAARITLGAGGAVKWDSDTPHTGTRSLRIDGGNPAAFTICNPAEAASDLAHGYFRCYSRMPSLPAANFAFAAIYNSTPAVTAQLRYGTSGELILRNGSGTVVATSTTTFGAMTWFGWEWHLDDAANTQTLNIYDATYSNLRESISGSYTGLTRRFQIGNVSAWPNSYSAWFDDIAISDSAATGPLGSAQPTNSWKVPHVGGGWDDAIAKILVGGVWT